MAKPSVVDTARVEFRMNPELKNEVEEAAALLGVSLTAFATETIVARARQVKREHAMTVLCDEDRDAFLEMLAKPPAPSPALIKLMQTKVRARRA